MAGGRLNIQPGSEARETGGTGRLVLLGAIIGLGSLAIQLLVPALPLISESLATDASGGQLIITLYMAAIAVGQLVWAPVSDHWGRRPILFGGLAIFLAGTVACAFAANLGFMLAGRLVQAFGASALLVIGRAMATDRAPLGKAAAPLALMTGITLISPAFAPAVGGLITTLAGWRTMFWMLAALTLFAGVAAISILTETRPGDRLPFHPARLAAAYWKATRHPGFFQIAFANAVIVGSYYLFLTISPFLLDEAGASPALAGLFYSALTCLLTLGVVSVPLVMKRWPGRIRSLSSVALCLGAATLLFTAASGPGLVGLFLAMGLIAFAAGLTGPSLLGEAIDDQRERASLVASLYGTMHMAGAALISTIAMRLVPGLAWQLVTIALLVLLALAVRHYRPAEARNQV